MSFEKYAGIIKDETYYKILVFCKVQRSTAEIIDDMTEYLNRLYPNTYDSRMKVAEVVGTRLGKLEQLGALIFQGGKWRTSLDAIEILSKYFGL